MQEPDQKRRLMLKLAAGSVFRGMLPPASLLEGVGSVSVSAGPAVLQGLKASWQIPMTVVGCLVKPELENSYNNPYYRRKSFARDYHNRFSSLLSLYMLHDERTIQHIQTLPEYTKELSHNKDHIDHDNPLVAGGRLITHDNVIREFLRTCHELLDSDPEILRDILTDNMPTAIEYVEAKRFVTDVVEQLSERQKIELLINDCVHRYGAPSLLALPPQLVQYMESAKDNIHAEAFKSYKHSLDSYLKGWGHSPELYESQKKRMHRVMDELVAQREARKPGHHMAQFSATKEMKDGVKASSSDVPATPVGLTRVAAAARALAVRMGSVLPGFLKQNFDTTTAPPGIQPALGYTAPDILEQPLNVPDKTAQPVQRSKPPEPPEELEMI